MMGDWVSWTNSYTEDQLNRHTTAASWAILLTIFAYLVIMMDTRDRVNRGHNITLRDRILGVEQRYFLAILNGVLLYFSLLVLLKTPLTS